MTPRQTRLIRAAGLSTFQLALVEVAFQGTTLEELRARAIVVSTRAGAAALQRTIEDARLDGTGHATLLPAIVTRGELYALLHERAGGEPPRLTEFEREALLRRAAREVAGSGIAPPFALRPGIIVQILRFYDELRRRQRTVDDFERLVADTLADSAEYDRGAERLLRQTRFLAAVARAYEAALLRADGLDEHRLRRLLLERPLSRPLTHVIVATGDEVSGEGGLWPVDFDLLARLPGLRRLDIVATEEQLASGLYERVLAQLPGIEETIAAPATLPPPVLLAPAAREAPLYFAPRDREEELVEVARLLKSRRSPSGRFGVVFQRPLPYLYLARQVFDSGGIGYDATDALPLAAEPFAAALDALFACLVSDYTRTSLVELVRLPQFGFGEDGRRVSAAEAAALNRLLAQAKFLGERDQLARVRSHPRATGPALRALDVAIRVASDLDAVRTAASASAQLETLAAFIRRYERPPSSSAPWRERHLRARAAVLATLEGLSEAHRRYDDSPVTPAELSATVRRWIEGQTFSPRTGTGGVHLVDADAARFGAFDELRIVGLIERDWPPRAGRNVFYPVSLLAQLGWPAEAERLAAARAAFRDLLRLPRRRLSLSAPSLEDDALVAPSTFLEELEAAGLPIERPPAGPPMRLFVHDALAMDPVVPIVTGDAAEWLQLRLALDDPQADRFRGWAGPRPGATYAVSHLERYLECPFKYFAAHVLKLDEERDEEAGMSPAERGQFLHDLLMEFFSRWQAGGGGAITAANIETALSAFRSLVHERLPSLSPLDRALEEARLLGSAAVPGLAERLFAFELERDAPIVERLLEHRLEGEYTFSAGGRERTVRIRSQADRIDLLADGTLRIIDYKLGRAPRLSRALQLPIYGVCASQHLEGHRGQSWRVGEAGYVAFGEPEVFKALALKGTIAGALETGQRRLLDAVEAIERGEFPPRPDEPYLCTRCAFAHVCRKDYVGDE